MFYPLHDILTYKNLYTFNLFFFYISTIEILACVNYIFINMFILISNLKNEQKNMKKIRIINLECMLLKMSIAFHFLEKNVFYYLINLTKQKFYSTSCIRTEKIHIFQEIIALDKII